MLPPRAITLLGRAGVAVLAIALAGCQTAGPAAQRATAPQSSAKRAHPSQTAQARKTNVATSGVLGVGF
jgi:hypothetical protein